MRRSSPSRRARAVAALVALVALAAGPRSARAATAPAIAWDAPAGCPDVGVLQAEVARLVGAAESPEVADIRVRVERRDDAWELLVTLSADGRALERTLTTGSCEAATRAAAFIVAMAIDPAIGGGLVPAPDLPPSSAPPAVTPAPAPSIESPVVAPAPAVTPAPASDPAPRRVAPAPAIESPAVPIEPPIVEPGSEDDPSRPPPARRPRSPRGLLQLGPGVQAGILPVGPGITAATGLLWPRLRVAVGYTRWFPTRVRPANRPEIGAELAVHAATLRVGPVLRAGPLELPLHLGVELGALRAVGLGGDDNFTRRGLWAAATLGAGLAWAPRALRGHGALVLAAEAALALHRPSLVFNDDIEVDRLGPAAFRGQLALEARFP